MPLIVDLVNDIRGFAGIEQSPRGLHCEYLLQTGHFLTIEISFVFCKMMALCELGPTEAQ